MIPDERPNLHPITTTFQSSPAKTEICWFHLRPHNNNRKEFQHVDTVDQLKYLGGEDSKEDWYTKCGSVTPTLGTVSLVLVY
jgi:hypothetical protein